MCDLTPDLIACTSSHTVGLFTMKTKILVLHPNPDNLDAIIKKAILQNSKNGPFEAVLLLGKYDLKACPTVPEVPTYYTGSIEQKEQFTDIMKNLICVTGGFLTLKLASGVKIGFFDRICEDATGDVDILVSFHWPLAIAKTQGLSVIGDREVDKMVTKLQPRYHFAVGTEKGRFYEHPAFPWTPTKACRMISLGQEGSGNKWFYAFSIDPLESLPFVDGVNPFKIESQNVSVVEEQMESGEKLQPLKRASENDEQPVKRPKIVAPQECFFCLSNPNIESHMIVAIGKHSYLATAKGPMPLPQRPLDFSGHAIIIPFDHTPIIEDREQREEMAQFQKTVAAAFYEKSFATVFFQISRPENVHIHTQLIPVRLDGAQEQFERSINERTRQNNERAKFNQLLEFTSDTKQVKAILESKNFIKFVLSMGDKIKVYAAQLVSEKPVDLQFPRRVMSFHLKCPKRTYWDRCKQTKAHEINECEKFKAFYKKYDFTS